MTQNENQYEVLYNQDYVVTLWFENVHEQEIHLFIEPWGEVCEIPPGEFIRILAKNPKYEALVLYSKNLNCIYSAWPQSVFAV